ncbi:hypothetical protein SAMN02910263_00639 [Butyrivibrio sp. INlla16]|nr:hypothetical protein SAMN02910263_00639 [Butyrivibrio sp. INlla16]
MRGGSGYDSAVGYLDVLKFSNKDIKSQYKCTDPTVRDWKKKHCSNCTLKEHCKEGSALRYKQYKKKRNAALKEHCFCELHKRICTLEMCTDFKKCNRVAKQNKQRFVNAFMNDNRELLNKLSKGGF